MPAGMHVLFIAMPFGTASFNRFSIKLNSRETVLTIWGETLRRYIDEWLGRRRENRQLMLSKTVFSSLPGILDQKLIYGGTGEER